MLANTIIYLYFITSPISIITEPACSLATMLQLSMNFADSTYSIQQSIAARPKDYSLSDEKCILF